MAFSEVQARLLASKLNRRHVRTRESRGRVLSYLEGWHVIAVANRIFGFEGWDREIVWCECVWEDGRRDPKACAYAARVRIRVRAGDGIVFTSLTPHRTGPNLKLGTVRKAYVLQYCLEGSVTIAPDGVRTLQNDPVRQFKVLEQGR